MAMTTMDSPLAAGSMRQSDHSHASDHRHSPDGHRPQAETILAPEDRQLIQDCLQGLPEAWDAFVARFGGLLAFVVDRTAAQRQMTLTPADRDAWTAKEFNHAQGAKESLLLQRGKLLLQLRI
jgi:hypothetical protein